MTTSPTLASFALPEPHTIVMPNKSKVPIRPLSLELEDQIEAIFPYPDVPMVKDPGKGSKAPEVENRDDPEYKESCVRAYYSQRLIKIAVAIGLEHEGEDFAIAQDRVQWCALVISKLTNVVTREWVEYAERTLNEISLPDCIAKAASGNSSTPQN